MTVTTAHKMAFIRGGLGLALLRTFAARSITSAGGFVLVVVLGRLYGTEGVGVFALAQSLIMASALISRYGMDNALMRFVGRDLQSPHVYAYLRHAVVRAMLVSTAAGVVIFLSRNLWAQLFHAPELPPVLVGIAIATPAFTLCYILAGFMKAVRRPATACLMLRGGVALVTAGFVWAINRWAFADAGIGNLGIAYAVSAWAIAVLALWLCRRWFSHRPPSAKTQPGLPALAAFKRSSSAFFASNLAQFMIAVLGIWIAGYFLSNSAVGLFKAANQLAMLIGVILFVMNVILPPRFAKFSHDRNHAALSRLARRGVLLGVALAAVPVVACLAVPEWILGVVGHDFPEAAVALRILAVGKLIAVGCGSVGHLLNMTGRETLQRNIAWLGNGFGLLTVLVLTPLLGIAGTSIGVTMAMASKKFIGLYFVWRELGIWMLPLPNVLQLFGISARKQPEPQYP